MTPAILSTAPARGQETTTTSSSGERFEQQDFYEYGEGSTIFTVNFRAAVGTDEIDVGSMSRYFVSYTPEEIAQASPPGYDFYVDGALVSITGWSAPQFVSSQYDIIDVFSEETSYYDVVSIVTTQLTSGDGPDAVVPVGWRGGCYFDGTSGATNLDPFDGQFAGCDYADSYVDVAPGTINTNTHTTTVYRQGTYYFQTVDDAYTDVFLFAPTATATTSSGTLETTSASSTVVRNDSHRVMLTGTLAGTTIFAQAIAGQFGDQPVQNAVEVLSRPRGFGLGGAPVVLVWSDPARTGSDEQLTSSSSETVVETTTGTIETLTTSIGGEANAGVFIGDRGACTDVGTSGTTSGTAPTGAPAICEGGAFYSPNAGVTNTNRHTTTVANAHSATTVTENWLVTENWALAATAVPIGQIHAAVRDAFFDSAGDFALRQGDALDARNGLGFGLWAEAFTGEADRDTDSAGPGSRRSAGGIAGGIAFRLSGIAGVAAAVSYETGDSDLSGLPETADFDHTQVGVAAELLPGIWRLAASAGRGWGEVDTTRGGESIGGVARASYDAATWFAVAEAGPELAFGAVTLRPLVALDWSRVSLGEFAERGGIALEGEDDSASRLTASIGAQLASRANLPAGPGLRLWADARLGQVLDGRQRSREVAFVDDPDAALEVVSASESGTYALGRAGVSLFARGGFGFHLGAEGQTGGGESGWQATAGISAAL